MVVLLNVGLCIVKELEVVFIWDLVSLGSQKITCSIALSIYIQILAPLGLRPMVIALDAQCHGLGQRPDQQTSI